MEDVVADVVADCGVPSRLAWCVTAVRVLVRSLNIRPSGGPGLTDILLDELKLLQQPGDSKRHYVIYSNGA